MSRNPFLLKMSLATLTGVLLSACPAGAGGPDRVAGAYPGPFLRSQRAIQEPIVPHGFFTLPPANRVLREGIVPRGFFSLPPDPPPLGDGKRHRRGHGHSVVGGVFAPPIIVSTPPVEAFEPEDYPGPPVYYAAPAAHGPPPMAFSPPPAAFAPPPPAPSPIPTVVQYDHGRYELRGDGMAAPYTWVWIPNPPPPPPPAAPPAPPLADDAPARPSQLYRWVDEQGVVHLTDRLDTVPRQYRSQAKPS